MTSAPECGQLLSSSFLCDGKETLHPRSACSLSSFSGPGFLAGRADMLRRQMWVSCIIQKVLCPLPSLDQRSLVTLKESISQTAKELRLPQSLTSLRHSLRGSIGPILKSNFESCTSCGFQRYEKTQHFGKIGYNQQERIVQTTAMACSALFGPWPADSAATPASLSLK